MKHALIRLIILGVVLVAVGSIGSAKLGLTGRATGVGGMQGGCGGVEADQSTSVASALDSHESTVERDPDEVVTFGDTSDYEGTVERDPDEVVTFGSEDPPDAGESPEEPPPEPETPPRSSQCPHPKGTCRMIMIDLSGGDGDTRAQRYARQLVTTYAADCIVYGVTDDATTIQALAQAPNAHTIQTAGVTVFMNGPAPFPDGRRAGPNPLSKANFQWRVDGWNTVNNVVDQLLTDVYRLDVASGVDMAMAVIDAHGTIGGNDCGLWGDGSGGKAVDRANFHQKFYEYGKDHVCEHLLLDVSCGSGVSVNAGRNLNTSGVLADCGGAGGSDPCFRAGWYRDLWASRAIARESCTIGGGAEEMLWLIRSINDARFAGSRRVHWLSVMNSLHGYLGMNQYNDRGYRECP